MPYKNIHWIKLKLELLRDRRFTDFLNERQQLLYLKFLLLAGYTENKIPKDAKWIKRETNYRAKTSVLWGDIEQICRTFGKFEDTGSHLRFINFNELHNFRSSQGTPKDVPEKIREEKKEIRSEQTLKEEDVKKKEGIQEPSHNPDKPW